MKEHSPNDNFAIAEAARLLNRLDPKATKFTFQTFDDNGVRGDKKLLKVFNGALAQHAAELRRLNDLGAGVFVTINETDGKGRKAANIVRVRAVFADLDGVPLEPVRKAESPPHIIVESSPGRWHCYWLVEGMPLGDFTAVQQAISKRFNSDANIKDLPRVMRLPGFMHRKSAPFRSRIVSTHDTPPYPAANFQRVAANDPFTDYGGQARAGRGFENILAELGDGSGLKGFHEVLRDAVASYAATYKDALDNEKLKTILRDEIDKAPKKDTRRRAADIKRYRSDAYLDDLIASAIGKYGHPDEDDDGEGATVGVDGLFTIRIKAGKELATVKRAEEILINAGVEIYQHGEKLARPIIAVTDAAHGRKTEVARLREITPAFLNLELCGVIRWEKYDARKKEYVRTRASAQVTTDILSQEGRWPFPSIAGIISTPTMRPDGSLLLSPGYDAATRLLLVAPPPMPPMPDAPTLDDALAALAQLEELLDEFPFDSEVSKAVALSAMLTPVVRGAFPVTPAHISRAAVPASGKSYLWDVTAAIATGKRMPVMAAGRNEEETEKRLNSAILASQPLISIDNINGEISGEFIGQAIERPVVQIRPLGKTETIEVEARGTSIFMTGNNIVVVGDLGRRVITTVLDPRLERPELRRFKKKPFELVLEDRGKYIAACLTICRAYAVAGRPNAADPLASFEDWSDAVRSALIWLGKGDPVASMRGVREEDPERNRLLDMLTAWADAIGIGEACRCATSSVIKLSNQTENALNSTPRFPELHDAVQAVARKKRGPADEGQVDGDTFGKWLRSKKGVIVGDLRFANAPTPSGKALWWVEHLDGEEQRYRAEQKQRREPKAKDDGGEVPF